MHATDTQLALFATGELGWMERFRIRFHVNACERCRQEMAAFEEARNILDDEAKHGPSGEAWGRLAAEMTANIRLGVEAGECVRVVLPEPERTKFDWNLMLRPGLAVAGLIVFLYAGTWMVARKMQSGVTNEAGSAMTLEAKPDALEIRGNGAAFSLVRASTAPVALSVGVGGSLAAREMDEDTGQVTIYHVYAE